MDALLKIHMQTLTDAQAGKLAGENPDYGIQKLFEAIESGNYPSWTVYIVNTLAYFFQPTYSLLI
jgi:catalase